MKEKYYALLELNTKKTRDELKDTMSFRDDLCMSSLDVAMLYPQIEDEFHITFSPIEDDLGEIFRTVGTLWEFIAARGSL